MGLTPLGGSWDLKKQRGSHTQRNPLTNREISWGRRRTSGAVGRECNSWSVAGRTDSPCQYLCAPAHMCLPVCIGAGCWNMRTREQTQGRDCCWMWGSSLKGWEWGNPQPEMLVEETWLVVEPRHHYWPTCKGWSHHFNLTPKHQPCPFPRG